MAAEAPNDNSKVDEADVGALTAGELYAKALLGAAESAGAVDAVLGDLETWVDGVLNKNVKLDQILSSDVVPEETKIEMIDRALKGKAHPIFVNFLKVAAEHGRLGTIRNVRLAARHMLDKSRGRVPVTVTTAAPLDQKQSSAMKDRLKGLLGGDPVVSAKVDPKLIGGIVVRVGDVVFDGSIANSLARLKEQMINRSVHEIQRRRDRVSPAS